MGVRMERPARWRAVRFQSFGSWARLVGANARGIRAMWRTIGWGIDVAHEDPTLGRVGLVANNGPGKVTAEDRWSGGERAARLHRKQDASRAERSEQPLDTADPLETRTHEIPFRGSGPATA